MKSKYLFVDGLHLSVFLILCFHYRYIKNAKITSAIFKDRPMSPEKSVAYWTDYVIRHKGAPHLKSQALNLTWYQYFLLDIVAVMLIFIFIFMIIVLKFFKCIHTIYTKICPSFSKVKSD